MLKGYIIIIRDDYDPTLILTESKKEAILTAKAWGWGTDPDVTLAKIIEPEEGE